MSGSWRGVLRLAWRESRNTRRRLLLFMSAISAGVAALVAIDSYAGNVTRSVRAQARTLLGADVRLASRDAPAAGVDTLLDSLRESGIDVARVTTFLSMTTGPATDATRLAQVRGVEPGFPYYGDIVTLPASAWGMLHDGRNALADPALLLSLGAQVGDSVTLGERRFRIVGAVESVPGEPEFSAMFAPRLFIPYRYVVETGLLTFGSRADHDAMLRLPVGADAEAFEEALESRFDTLDLRATTVDDTRRSLTRGVDELRRFLGIVGLVALLLGGIGVASAIHAFVSEKRPTAAVLRCLGATSRQVLVIYVTEAAMMGLAGALFGALAGIGLQYALPRVIGGFVPVDVVPTLEPLAVLSGLAVGVLVATLFALEPLLALRRVSPLAAIRESAIGDRRGSLWRDPARLGALALLAAAVVFVAIGRTGDALEGTLMSVALAAAIGVLSLSAALLARGARSVLRERWPFVVRQGIANLYRPANQTRAVMLALGFGAFLLSTLYLVQVNVLRQLDIGADATRANLLLFDIQRDQVAGVEEIVRQAGAPVLQTVPVIPMRIVTVNDVSPDDLTSEQRTWAHRREYRSSYRDTVTASETILAGEWFTPGDSLEARGVYEVSLDREIAEDLSVGVGDRITWDVQGVIVRTRITSLREVNFARFEPNFFAVFEPEALRDAPATFVVLTGLDTSAARARLQRAIVDRFSNVTAIDLALIQNTVAAVLGRVSVAVRFMAVFSLATGVIVLLGAIAASRRQRIREGVLLKTLGATRGQLRRILVAEYLVLGVLGSLTGMILSIGGGWALTRFVFEMPFSLATGPLLAIAAGMMALTLAIGLTSGRQVFRATPIEALRTA
jgi:putative ABC transport system permease protein